MATAVVSIAGADEAALTKGVEAVLYLREQGWLDDTQTVEQIKAAYIELFGPDALKDSPNEADCDD